MGRQDPLADAMDSIIEPVTSEVAWNWYISPAFVKLIVNGAPGTQLEYGVILTDVLGLVAITWNCDLEFCPPLEVAVYV